ncbi:MAG: radical SAM protein, partial [Bacilli bacterium]|nr:radical SAM protein [Bacilli bacterium]
MNNEYKYQEITCKSALNRIDSFLPYHYDLNIY